MINLKLGLMFQLSKKSQEHALRLFSLISLSIFAGLNCLLVVFELNVPTKQPIQFKDKKVS